MKARFVPGRLLRWYLTRARHPFKRYVVGHYWSVFCAPRVWIPYDDVSAISVSLRDYLQQLIFFEGYYEKDLVAWMKRNLQPDDVFWDVGANIGAISLVAATRCRRVFAFEPDPRSLALLEQHRTVNAYRNIDIVPVALTDRNGKGTLHQADAANSGMTSLSAPTDPAAGRVEVVLQRADDFLAAHPDAAPTIIKIDIEGEEGRAFAGARDLLTRTRPRAVIFEAAAHRDRPDNPQAMALLESAGYAVALLSTSDPRVDDGRRNFLATPVPAL